MLLALLKISSRLCCTHSRATAAPLGFAGRIGNPHVRNGRSNLPIFTPPQVAGPDKKDQYEDVRANSNSRVCLNNNAAFTGEPACASRFCISGLQPQLNLTARTEAAMHSFCVLSRPAKAH